MNIMKKIWNFKWLIFSLIILYPFLCLAINKITGITFGELYTFDLVLKDFLTLWVAFCGIIGAFVGIWQMQKRITIQEKQLTEQQERWGQQDKRQDDLRDEQRKQFNEQIKNQNNQVQIQQKQLRDSRFSSGIELLGNEKESVRIGGSYNLFFLASDFRDEYLKPVCEILCAHIRTTTNDKDYQDKHKEKPSNEIQTILYLLFREDFAESLIFANCKKNLRTSFLKGANFVNTTINNTTFSSSNLFDAIFRDVIITNSSFNGAILDNINFKNIKIEKSKFWRTKFCNVHFNNITFNDVIFTESNIKDTFFAKTFCKDISFRGSIIQNTHFNKVRLVGYDFNKTKFIETVFSFRNDNQKEDFLKTIFENYSLEGIAEENLIVKFTN